MEVVDYKYRYRFECPESITWEQWDKMRYEVWLERNNIFEKSGLSYFEYDENMRALMEVIKENGL